MPDSGGSRCQTVVAVGGRRFQTVVADGARQWWQLVADGRLWLTAGASRRLAQAAVVGCRVLGYECRVVGRVNNKNKQSK